MVKNIDMKTKVAIIILSAFSFLLTGCQPIIEFSVRNQSGNEIEVMTDQGNLEIGKNQELRFTIGQLQQKNSIIRRGRVYRYGVIIPPGREWTQKSVSKNTVHLLVDDAMTLHVIDIKTGKKYLPQPSGFPMRSE